MPCLSERCAHGFVDGPVSGELARVGNVTDSNREFSDGHLLRGAFQSSWPPPPPKRIPPARGGCRVCSGSLRPAEGRPARRMRFVSGVGGLPAGLMRVENHGWIWGGVAAPAIGPEMYILPACMAASVAAESISSHPDHVTRSGGVPAQNPNANPNALGFALGFPCCARLVLRWGSLAPPPLRPLPSPSPLVLSKATTPHSLVLYLVHLRSAPLHRPRPTPAS